MNGEKGSSDKAAGLISAGVEVVELGGELQNGQLVVEVVGLGGELQNGQLVVMQWMASKVSIGLRPKKTPGQRGNSHRGQKVESGPGLSLRVGMLSVRRGAGRQGPGTVRQGLAGTRGMDG